MFEPKDFLYLSGIAIAFVVQWAIRGYRGDRIEKDFEDYKCAHAEEVSSSREDRASEFESFRDDVWREVGKLREWRHSHLEETGKMRLELEKTLGQIQVSIADKSGKFDTIAGMQTEIMKRLDKLDQKIDRIETREG